MIITEEHARKVIAAVKPGLCRGLGEPTPGKMCVEAAVCYALGAPHSDNHECIGYAVRAFKITLNDLNWSSNGARAIGLRRVAVAQLGSNEVNQIEFATRLAARLPAWLETVFKRFPATKSAAYATKSAAEYATKSAAAEYATKSAAYAAKSAAYAAYAAKSAEVDLILGEIAEIAVQVLIELKSPGTLYLSLCDE